MSSNVVQVGDYRNTLRERFKNVIKLAGYCGDPEAPTSILNEWFPKYFDGFTDDKGVAHPANHQEFIQMMEEYERDYGDFKIENGVRVRRDGQPDTGDDVP